MSYSRWIDSHWYAFDNVNGRFALWHCAYADRPDHDYETLRDHRKRGTLNALLRATYPGTSFDDIAEAIEIIERALERNAPDLTILELPSPRQDLSDPQGLRILPYVTVHTLEQLASQGNFPDEYKPYLIDAVRRITENGQ